MSLTYAQPLSSIVLRKERRAIPRFAYGALESPIKTCYDAGYFSITQLHTYPLHLNSISSKRASLSAIKGDF